MTTVLMFALVLFGWVAFRALPVSDLPNVDFPTIQVSAVLSGASPDVMATSVATPLERQFTTISGLDSMSSESSTGSTRITLQFSLARDIDAAAQDVQTAIAAASRRLPQGLQSLPTLRKVNPADAAILYLALTAPNLKMTELNDYANTRIAQRLSTLTGVAQVLVFGSQKYAVRIYLNPHALAARKLGYDQVASAVQNANSNLPTGTLQSPSRAYNIRAYGQLENAAAFNSLVVAYIDGAAVRLADLGQAVDSVENNKTRTWFNSERAIVLAIQRQPGANTVAVVKNIRDILPEINEQLPGGASLNVLNDRAEFIQESLHEVQFTLLLAVVLVIGVIFFFLNNASASLISVVVLPTSLLGTFLVMHLLGLGLDNISLMALTLAVGFVVDDAIIVIENINRHVEQGMDRRQAALLGTQEISFTVVSMTLSLVAVFIPILFMGGILGRLFHAFAVAIGVAVLLSGIVSLTLTPMLCSRYLKPTKKHGWFYHFSENLFNRWRDSYAQSLEWSMAHRGLMLFIAFAVLVVTIVLYVVVPKGFVPRMDTGQISGNTRAAEGIGFDELVVKQQAVTDIVRKHPAVAAVMSSAGQGLGGVSGGNIGRLVVKLKPLSQRKQTADEVIKELRGQMRVVTGMEVFLQNPPAINIGGLRTNAEYQYVIQGPDLPTLQKAAAALEVRLQGLSGLQDVSSSLELRNPQIDVHVLRDQASSYGLTPQQILATLYSAFGGREVTSIYGASDEYQVLIELDPKYQKNIEALYALNIKAPNGVLVPLGAVAQILPTVGPLTIAHFGQLPAVTVSFNLSPGTSIGSVTPAIETAGREVFPRGVTGKFAGAAQSFQQSMVDLPLLLGFTILVIYMILAILYEHFGHPITILTALPLAGFGALLVLLVFHQELNIFSFVGIILLVGLVKKNGIIMVDFAIDAQRNRGLTPERAMVEACLVRFRPIMMTTVAAIFATLPIALGFGAGAEARRPLGIAVVGGLVFSQLMTLYITPTFYVSLENLSRRKRKPLSASA